MTKKIAFPIILDEKSVRDLIKQLHTRGRWEIVPDLSIYQSFDECRCSECGAVEYFMKGWKKYNFCPSCGADMRED